MERRVTSSDVARAAGVSRTAVSLVLNGRADGMIDPAKQTLVRRIAKDLGYIPNAAAVSLRRQRTATIGLITDEIASAAFAGPLISGASDQALQGGYMVLTIDTRQHADYVEDAITTLRSRDIDGIVYAAASVREVELPEAARKLPVVLSNAFGADIAIPSYIPDDRGGERAVTELVLAAGHRRICFATGDRDAHATAERIRGFRDAMKAAGQSVGRGDVISGHYSFSGGYEAALRVLGRPDRPTALLCANDRAAAGAVLAAVSLGLSVPDDLSVIGYDDEKFFADEVRPTLTTVALPHREMGEAAVRHLIGLIEADPDTPATGVTLVPCAPVQRQSLAGVPEEVRAARS